MASLIARIICLLVVSAVFNWLLLWLCTFSFLCTQNVSIYALWQAQFLCFQELLPFLQDCPGPTNFVTKFLLGEKTPGSNLTLGTISSDCLHNLAKKSCAHLPNWSLGIFFVGFSLRWNTHKILSQIRRPLVFQSVFLYNDVNGFFK